MPLIGDFGLKQGLFLNFVQTWSHKIYPNMFIDSGGTEPGDITSVHNMVNCTYDSGTQSIIPTLGYTSFSFRINGSTVNVNGLAYPVLYNGISVSLLKSTLGISHNSYSGIFTSDNINMHSAYKSNKTTPHSSSEMRRYFHGTGWKLDSSGSGPASVEYTNQYQLSALIQRQQNTPESYNYKVGFYNGGNLISESTGVMTGSYHKQISSSAATNNNSGYNSSQSHSVRLYYQDDALNWVEDLAARSTFDITLKGPWIVDSTYFRTGTLSKSVTVTLAMTNQSGSTYVVYPRAKVYKNGVWYDSTNSDSISVANGNYSGSFTFQFSTAPNLLSTDPIGSVELVGSDSKVYSVVLAD